MHSIENQRVWILTDGKPGMENQCLGLAEELGVLPVVKRVSVLFPWSYLPPQFWFFPLSICYANREKFIPPWPDIVIATGRQTVALALAIKSASNGKTFCIQIQNPVIWKHKFDVIVIPAHDKVTGNNVIATIGALHRVTSKRLAQGADELRGTLSHLPLPIVTVLVGGSNRKYKMGKSFILSLAKDLRKLQKTYGVGIVITVSRRTGGNNAKLLRKALSGQPFWIWDGQGPNPYFGLLGIASFIVVTADSISMISEACATGKPVFIIKPDGGSSKFNRFHTSLEKTHVIRNFTGNLEEWVYTPPNDTARVALEIKRILRERHKFQTQILPENFK